MATKSPSYDPSIVPSKSLSPSKIPSSKFLIFILRIFGESIDFYLIPQTYKKSKAYEN